MQQFRHRSAALWLWALALASSQTFAATWHLDDARDLPDDQAARLSIAKQPHRWLNLIGAGFDAVELMKLAYPKDGKWALVAVDQLRRTEDGEDAIAVAPGTYYVHVRCGGSGTGLLLGAAGIGRRNSLPVRVEAGYDYRFVCTGHSLSSLRVDVVVQPRAGQALRPVPGEGVQDAWTPPSHPYVDVPRRSLTLPVDIDDARVMSAAAHALEGRGWRVDARHGVWVRGTLDHDEERLVVDMVRIGGSLQVVHVDSAGLDYRIEDGVASIRRQYFGWTNYLLHDVATTLGVPSPIE